MDKLRLYIWKLFYSPEEIDKKREHLLAKRVAHLLNGASGGGTEAMTFWEKVEVGLLIFILVALSVGMMVAVIVASAR